jgi:alkylation response protein AidB-like acyl-CoA dehydrogenase
MGDNYLVNGTKNWITNGQTSSVCLVLAQTHPELKHKGINCLVIEKNQEGFVVGKKKIKWASEHLTRTRSCLQM